MYFSQEMFNVIQNFSGTDNNISLNKVYLRYVGDLQTGAFLSQVVYWCDKSSRKDGFFYKTYDEWKNELFMSEYSIRKAVKELKELGILETKLIKANGSPTIHYKLNKSKFTHEIVNFLTKEKAENDGLTVENSGICEIEESNLRNQRMESAKSKNPICEIEDSITSLTTSRTTSRTTKKDISLQIENLRQRYSENQLKIIDDYLEMIKHTRVSGKISDSVILRMYESWNSYPTICVEYGLYVHTIKVEYHSRKENYTLGIIRGTSSDEAVYKLQQLRGQVPPTNNKKSLFTPSAETLRKQESIEVDLEKLAKLEEELPF